MYRHRCAYQHVDVILCSLLVMVSYFHYHSRLLPISAKWIFVTLALIPMVIVMFMKIDNNDQVSSDSAAKNNVQVVNQYQCQYLIKTKTSGIAEIPEESECVFDKDDLLGSAAKAQLVFHCCCIYWISCYLLHKHFS